MNKRFLQQVVFGGVNTNSSQPAPSGMEPKEPETSPFPTIVALPRELVTLLDEAAQGSASTGDFQNWAAGLEQQIQSLAQFTLHDAELKCLKEANQNLASLNQAFLSGDLNTATEHALLTFRAMTRFDLQRTKNRQSTLPGVNDVLICGISIMQDRARPELLEHFLPGLIADVDRMVALFKQGESHLPDEVKMAILTGLDRATKGVTSLQELEPGNQGQLKDALALVADGAGLLSQLQAWEDEYEASANGAVPVVGLTVQLLLEEIRERGQLSEKSLRTWLEREHPKFMQFWMEARGSLLIRTEVREPTIEKIDAVAQQLGELANMDPHQQNRALRELDDLFLLVSNNQMPLSKLERCKNRWIGDLCLAIAAGGIPMFYLDKTYKETNQQESEELAKALDMYLETGDTDLLLTLLENLLKSVK